MENPIVREEFQGKMFGAPGRFSAVTIGGKGYRPGTFTHQRWISEPRKFKGEYAEKGEMIRAEIRFDDSCRNGHNSFSITGETFVPGRRDVESCGCIHEAIAAHFPKLAPLIRWHLVSTDSPMHYVANTVYHASNRDHRGKLAGEPYAWDEAIQFGENPIKHKVRAAFWQFLKDAAPHSGAGAYDFEVIQIEHKERAKPGAYQFGPKFTFGGYGTAWHDCPFDTEEQAFNFLKALQTCSPQFVKIPTLFSEGKARDLDAARACGVWPDATDAELMQEPEALKAALMARLPALNGAFRADMDKAGLLWAPETESAES